MMVTGAKLGGYARDGYAPATVALEGFSGSWTVLISGTALGVSLVTWSIARTVRQRRQMRREEARKGFRALEPLSQPLDKPQPAVPPVEESIPLPMEDDEQFLLFNPEPLLCEPKPGVEEAPKPRRQRRRTRLIDEQLLLWPDADEPLPASEPAAP